MSLPSMLASLWYKVIVESTDVANKPGLVVCNADGSSIMGTSTIGGFSKMCDTSADNTAQAIKTSAGNLYKIDAINVTASVAYVQIFDLATTAVTVGTTPPAYVIMVPANGQASIDFFEGMDFTAAITYACTTTPTGNVNPASALVLSAGYK